jgi:recombination protein RecR
MGPLEELVADLSRFPGMGRKSALRLAFYFLKTDQSFLAKLGHEIATLRDRVRKCSRCGNFTETDPCSLCNDASRDARTLCVVEQVQDLMNLQKTGEYQGLYFVLHGVLAPLDGVGPQDLGLEKLAHRVVEEGIEEVILATNPTLEGDTTALYIHKLLAATGVRVTRLASGLPVGGDLEYADRLTIARSFQARRPLD